MTRPRFLIVGAGSIGRRHLQVLAERTDLDLAIHDSWPEALAGARQLVPAVTTFAALADALAWRPLIVIICTPNAQHRAVAEAAFAAGAHVLCEKPIADALEDGRAMVAAANASGKVLAVGYSERFRPALAHIFQMVAAGELGTVVGGRAMVGTYNTLLCAKTDYRAHVSGALLVDYTHEFDFLRAIFGEVAEVQCWANDLGGREKRCSPSLAATLLRFQSGAVVSVHMDYVQHPQRRTLEVYGDQRSLELDLETDILRVFDPAQPGGVRSLTFDHDRNNRFRAEHQDMLDAVQSGRAPRVTGEDGLKALEIAVRAIASSR
jgi:UDP-N-acetylglucosamine 3-dehydrogenase